MAKAGKKNPNQLALALHSADGALSTILNEAAQALSAALSQSGRSRDHICDDLARLLGRPVQVSRLNTWTAPTNANRLPADVLIALLVVLNDFQPLEALLAPTGMTLATPADRAAAELGDVLLEREKLAEREAAARRLLTKGRRQP